MSSQSPIALQSPAKLGPWLALLAACVILAGAFLLIVSGFLLWQSAIKPVAVYARLYTAAAVILSLASIVSSLLLLLHRHSRSVKAMILMFALTGLWASIGTLGILGYYYYPDSEWEGAALLRWILLLRGCAHVLHFIIAYAGWISYLLTAPRISRLYANRPPSTEVDSHKAMTRLLPLMVGLPAWGLIEIVAVLLVIQAPFDDRLILLPIDEPRFRVCSILLSLLQISVGLFLGFGRTRRSLRLALCCLWALPILALPYSLLTQSSPYIVTYLIDPFPGSLPAIFGALGWTAYLLESPYIRRRYPNSSQLKNTATDLDIF